jgi:hypothetical protein
VSRQLDPLVPPALRERLDSDDLAAAEGFTMLLMTVTGDGWPHMAMVSVGEVVAASDYSLRLALWPGSTATRNLTPSGNATLAAVVDGTSYSLRLAVTRAGEVETPLAGQLARFEARVEGASADEAPYAVLESGVSFRLKDPPAVLARWAELRQALRDGV